MTVWAVSSGEYSDYRVHCCYTSRELATEHCARANGWTVDTQRRLDELHAMHWLDKTPAERKEEDRIERSASDEYADIFFVEEFALHSELAVEADKTWL